MNQAEMRTRRAGTLSCTIFCIGLPLCCEDEEETKVDEEEEEEEEGAGDLDIVKS